MTDESPDARVAALRAWSPEAAEEFRRLAADFGIELDYTPGSLAEVERLIAENFSGRGGKVKRKWRDLSGATGAYVTEVLLRNLGGEWAWEPEWEVGGIRLPSGAFTAPLAKSKKRYEDGPADEFVSYYRALEEVETEASR